MFLVDTNVLLEILLGQDRKEECKQFLESNIGSLSITDFCLHSIGVILFRYGKRDVFQRFTEDVIPNVRLLSLPAGLYGELTRASGSMSLDFDDAYQYTIAKHNGLKIATLDRDFEGVEGVEVLFL